MLMVIKTHTYTFLLANEEFSGLVGVKVYCVSSSSGEVISQCCEGPGFLDSRKYHRKELSNVHIFLKQSKISHLLTWKHLQLLFVIQIVSKKLLHQHHSHSLCDFVEVTQMEQTGEIMSLPDDLLCHLFWSSLMMFYLC